VISLTLIGKKGGFDLRAAFLMSAHGWMHTPRYYLDKTFDRAPRLWPYLQS
jgi:hypothetical protein